MDRTVHGTSAGSQGNSILFGDGADVDDKATPSYGISDCLAATHDAIVVLL
jgi:hypothetical protein